MHELVNLAVLALIFVLAAGEITDPDFFWHMAAGRLMWQTHTIPRADPFSFTARGREWVCHEWGSELIMYGLWRAAGEAGLIGLSALAITCAFALVLARCSRDANGEIPPYAAAAATLLAALSSLPTWGVRPQMATLLFASLTLYILERGKPLWLVPLQALWVNMHGGFPLGPTLTFAFALGTAIEGWRAGSPTARLQARKEFARLLPVGTAQIAASLVNPYGPRMLIYPIQTLTSSAMRQYIVEWHSPNFHEVGFLPLAMLILALLGTSALSRKRPPAPQLILLLGATYAALSSARHIPFLAITGAPALSKGLSELGGGRRRRPQTASRPAAIGLALAVIAILSTACAWRLKAAAEGSSAAQMKHYPVRAVDFMEAQHITGHVFNRYSWGGYLIWRGRKPFIDGRADVYGEFLKTYVEIYNARVSPHETFEEYDITCALVEAKSPIATLLRESGWQRVYQDELAAVFLKGE
ncbi:MAG TPA: hypothetical protein EYP09_04940 [Anaerolineae bacterium]|nr:hypothetical protein [Anaerolineae bacterium]